MFVLRTILRPLQNEFGNSRIGLERGTWFIYTLLAIITHFTSSRTSNLIRCLQTLFGFSLCSDRFYTFMASPKIPWNRLWAVLWTMIPKPTVDGRLLLALDDYINPKTGKKIFGCAPFFDHAAKINQSKYPWSQNVVAIGLLKKVKGRWAFLPMAFRFYHMQKTIEAGKVKINRQAVLFQSKFEQTIDMLADLSVVFIDTPILIVTDSWFGNNGLFKPLRKIIGQHCDILSRLRVNANLFDLPAESSQRKPDRPKKYGHKLGCATTLAEQFITLATIYSVNLYGKQRDLQAYDKILMLKTLKCPVRVVWVYRKSSWIALLTTDLDLSVEQIIEYYGARWKIESGFKEIKQDLGSTKTQTRNPHAVINHLNFCMMAATVTWIYADRIDFTPQRCHAVNNRQHFAFSDVRKLITQAALDKDFVSLCPIPHKPKQYSFINALLHMVA
jgi:IS4 transposase